MFGFSQLSPYALYIKLVLAILLIIGIIWFGWHESTIRSDLKKYQAEAELQKATASMYAQQFNNYIQLNKEIADAIKKVKVQSSTYIDSVEVSQPPVDDGGSFVLIAHGLPKALPSMPGYTNYTTGGAAANSP
jgi:hypothetical protein